MTFKLSTIACAIPIVTPRKGRPDIKPAIEDALRSQQVLDEMSDFLTNGGVQGNRYLDYNEAFLIVAAYDTKKGNRIASTEGLNRKEQIDQMNVVLRRFFHVEKGRIVGINTKRFALPTPNAPVVVNPE